MSQENVETVRAIYDRWSEGDFTASVAVFDPHVVLVLRPDFGPESPDTGVYHGQEAIAAYTREYLLKPWRHLTMEAEEILGAGDSVLVSVRQRGVGKMSGVPTEARYLTLWTFRGGKVIHIESFVDRDTALEAAGLSD